MDTEQKRKACEIMINTADKETAELIYSLFIRVMQPQEVEIAITAVLEGRAQA